jgi:hypothetical protein
VTLPPSPEGSAAALREWEELLSSYSAALDEHRNVLQFVEEDVAAEHDVVPAPTFVPREDMPPLPQELRPWAHTLMETTDALVRLATELSVRSEPRRATRSPQDAPATEATLDAFL